MGLDIYLNTRDEAAQNEAYNRASEELYEDQPDSKSKRDLMSDEEYAAWQEQYSFAPQVDVASERYPEHYWNRRYLRSSYNGSGFNHAVPQMLGDPRDEGRKYPNEYGSLYWIFEPMGRDWPEGGDEAPITAEEIPNLQICASRAREVASKLRDSDKLRVITVSPNMFMAPPEHTDDDALRLYREHIAERPDRDGSDGWYSTRGLEVFGDGLTILAAIPGKATFDIPGVHLIYRATAAIDSYIQAAEIAAEFCDEATMLIERDGSCSMSWSG